MSKTLIPKNKIISGVPSVRFNFESEMDRAKFLTVIATELFNEMIALDAFWAGIPTNKKFTHTLWSVRAVKNAIKEYLSRNAVSIGFYHSSWFFRNVVAHVKSGKPNTVYFNTRHYDFTKLKGESLEQDLRDKIETVAHELVHCADAINPIYDFGHGVGKNANNPKGKEHSWPYWFGRYAASFFNHDTFHTKLNTVRGSY